MQRHLPKFVFAIVIFTVLVLLPASSSALTSSRSSFSIKHNSTFTDTSINQATRMRISTNGEGTVVVNGTTVKISPTSGLQETAESKVIIHNTSTTVSPTDRQSELTSPINNQPVTPTNIQPTLTLRTTATPTIIQLSGALTDEKKTYIMKAINDYRKSLGLRSVQTSGETCAFAAIRAKEVSAVFNHDGFRYRLNNGMLPYSSWSLVTENLAMTSNYKNVVNMWIASSGHAANMRKDTPYVCVEGYSNYYAYEGMRP